MALVMLSKAYTGNVKKSQFWQSYIKPITGCVK